VQAPSSNTGIVFGDVSKFYGEVLGVNRVDLTIPAGITSLVGPNGSGKTTLMNLMAGLIQPSRGHLSVLGLKLTHPEQVFREVGYCTQYDSFPRGATGWDLVYSTLRLHGHGPKAAASRTETALQRVSLVDAAGRKIAGYSKGMRQRIKLAQAICHEPRVLILDEPLNGLDPLARSEVLALFREWGKEGRYLIISSHILHEVDMISDMVVILSSGYVVADGGVRDMRGEMETHPIQILIRCDRPAALAARLFGAEHVVEVKLHDDRKGLLVRTRDRDACFALLNRVLLELDLTVEAMSPADEDVQAVYSYLLGSEGGAA